MLLALPCAANAAVESVTQPNAYGMFVMLGGILATLAVVYGLFSALKPNKPIRVVVENAETHNHPDYVLQPVHDAEIARLECSIRSMSDSIGHDIADLKKGVDKITDHLMKVVG